MYYIAVVDDEKLYRDKLEKWIRDYALQKGLAVCVHCFSDGEDITDGYKKEYDIIFMDIRMRFMDGISAAEKIRQQDKKVLIIFMTHAENYM